MLLLGSAVTLVYMYAQIYGCTHEVYVHVCVHVHVCMHAYKPEVNFRYYLSGDVYLDFYIVFYLLFWEGAHKCHGV